MVHNIQIIESNNTVSGILGLADTSPNGRIIVARPESELAHLSDWRKGRNCLVAVLLEM